MQLIPMGFSSKNLQLTLSKGCQSIIVGYGILSDPNLLMRYVEGHQVFIVTNVTLASLYLPFLQKAFKEKQCDFILLPDGEAYKNQESLFSIYEKLMSNAHHRDTTIIALGGGVIGDLAGFAAATYQRGVSFVQIPTTLLAQVDASIGGKTAINHKQGKNVIGSFYQAKAVLMEIHTLDTLPLREFRAGFAEIIKYALLVGGDLLITIHAFLKDHAMGLPSDRETLAKIIFQCCKIKSQFVIEDENETKGTRFYLNLGHTIGHALEAYSNYERWLHGEAVAIGLYCMALISVEQSGLDRQALIVVEDLLTLAALPTRIPKDIPINDLLRLIKQDKKIRKNRLNMVLMHALGDCYIDNQLSEEVLYKALNDAVEQDDSNHG